MVRCPLCGVVGHACGPRTTVVPVDRPARRPKEDGMALETYVVDLNGYETTMQLTPEHAKRMGARKVGESRTATSGDATQIDVNEDGVKTRGRNVSTRARRPRPAGE